MSVRFQVVLEVRGQRAPQSALGGVARTRDKCRDQRGVPVLDSIFRDARHGARMLVKSPGFTVTAIAILSLGFGANAAIFSVVNAIVLKSLPFPDASRILRIWHTPPREQFPGSTRFSVSPANYLDWNAQSTAFDHLAVFGYRQANIIGRGEPDALIGAGVSGEFFQVLHASALIGRLLEPNDDDEPHAHVVVLSQHIWNSRFGADRRAVGQTIRSNGDSYAVVGVLPERLRYPQEADLWLPLAWDAEEKAVRGNHNYGVIAHLRPGADAAYAQAELTTISKRLEVQYPADDKGWGAIVVPLHDAVVGDVRAGLLVLLGAVTCVLLIACANLANLLLARVLGRSREIAIRAAVGASRWRIVQQLLIESSLLAGAGAIVFAQQQFAMRLLTAFAALALLLAAIGIYGVLSYGVRQRIQEIGIRMALGAATSDVVRMVVVEGLKPTGVGLLLGLIGSAALGQVLSSVVFGVTPRDAATFAMVSVVFSPWVLSRAWYPHIARRASIPCSHCAPSDEEGRPSARDR